MSDEALSALQALRDALEADVPLARTREEHMRVVARVHQAERVLALAAQTRNNHVGILTETVSEPSYSLTEALQPPPLVN